jgi:molecular chaperone GrpE
LAEKEKEKKEAGIPATQATPGWIEPDRFALLEAEKKELVDSLQRLQAEFENFKKRVEKEKLQCVCFGKAGVVSGLLAGFDAAVEKARKEKKIDSGLDLLHKQAFQAMQKLGLREIGVLGKQFNHETMDCVMVGNDTSKDDNFVLEEFQKGYILDGIVLRHAKVKVNRHFEQAEEKSCEEKKEKKPEERETGKKD